MAHNELLPAVNTIPHKSAEPSMGGAGIRVHFDNGYGVSIVSHQFSYGGNQGLYELAVLKGEELCHDTPITDDVIGWLTAEQAIEIAKKVEAL